jgi:RNA polymerase sigma factor (TIGR02999 family)
MRRILVDHARFHRYAKRGGGKPLAELDEADAVFQRQAAELIALDDALTDLSTIDPRKSQIVEMRYFGGMSVEETAKVLGVSSVTVMREWRTAKAWLLRAISTDASSAEKLSGSDRESR